MKLSELIAELLECQAMLKDKFLEGSEYLDPLVTIVHEGIMNEEVSIHEIYMPAFGNDKELRIVCDDLFECETRN